MDLDDARDAWHAGGDTGQAPSAADMLREARPARIPGALAPLVRGQLVALLLGLATALLGGAYLSRSWPMPWQSTIALTLILHGAATTPFAVRLRAGVAAHAVALAVLWRFASGPLGQARIERWLSARGIDDSLRLLEPFD